MKVLLLGEFSALHMNLKEGLRELGCQAVVAAHGDGFKKVPADISFDSILPSFLGKIERKLRPLAYLPWIDGYDVVQLMNPFIFHHQWFPSDYFFESIKRRNRKFFMLAAGDDAYFWRFGRKQLKYGPFDDYLRYDVCAESSPLESQKAFQFNKKLVDLSDGLIPVMYEYEKSYEGCPKRLKTIPIPVNTSKVKFQDNLIKGRLVVFHGLNRYGYKGTRHVEQAFNYLSKKYPNDLDLRIDGNLPLKQYLEVMDQANVVIDQVNSYSLGVNGIYAMAMGKVVMGGAEQESLESLGVTHTPVINIEPKPRDIVNKVEWLLDNKKDVQRIGWESRQFAERVHGHLKVAAEYIASWK